MLRLGINLYRVARYVYTIINTALAAQTTGERKQMRVRISLSKADAEELELEDPEALRERLDALHPLPSDILTNSGAPRTDNYFCGPRRPRLLRVFIYPGPRAFSTLLLSFARYHAPPRSFPPSYTATAIFRAESRRPFVLSFFLRGPEGPAMSAEKGEGRGETHSAF